MKTTTIHLTGLVALSLLFLSLVPFVSTAQEQTETTAIEAEASQEANYNNSRSNRANVSDSGETNVCDGATCADGSCAATPAECGAEETAVDSVCNGYLCDNGECATSASMCGVLEEEIDMVADSVCSDYLCDDGECVSDEAWCGVDFDFEVEAGVAADSVCNGYLCNDGTCVSSAAMCEMNFEELEAAIATCPADSPIRCGDGSCSGDVAVCRAIEARLSTPTDADVESRAQNHNSSRSNRTEGVAATENVDGDSDGDGLDDGTETTRRDDEDCDDDESCVRPGEANRAQDYNAARSNKPSRAIFSDTDTDGRPEVSFRGGAFVNVSNDPPTASAQNDGEGGVYCWGRAEGDAGKIYSWGRGICVASDATANASDTAQERLAALQVRGDDVRAWSDEQRSAWQEFRQTRATSTDEERLIERIVEKTQANERIREISADDEEVGMEYEADMRLFGVIPLQRTVNARATVAGEVTIDYPWYRFLSRVPEQSVIQETLRELQSLQVGGGGAGKATFKDISR